MAVPNKLSTVQSVAAANPEAWKQAHTGNSHTEDFIRILAQELHLDDPAFGNNGKRGDPEDISDDAINFAGEGADFDPTNNNMPCTVIDVISGAGGPSPTPAWQVVSNPAAPVGAAWVQPADQPEPEPEPEPEPVQPYPSESPDGGWWGQIADVEIAALYAHVGRPYPSDQKSLRWIGRIAYDIRDGLSKEDSLEKHLRELEKELGL